jgi:hypothetical protein
MTIFVSALNCQRSMEKLCEISSSTGNPQPFYMDMWVASLIRETDDQPLHGRGAPMILCHPKMGKPYHRTYISILKPSSPSCKPTEIYLGGPFQLVLAEQLAMPQQPLPFNEPQRSECDHQYESCSLMPTEPDGHEVRAGSLAFSPLAILGIHQNVGRVFLVKMQHFSEEGRDSWRFHINHGPLTGCYASLRPSYQTTGDSIHHVHKCTKSCFKKSLKVGEGNISGWWFGT